MFLNNFLKRKRRLHSFYFSQNTLMLYDSRGVPVAVRENEPAVIPPNAPLFGEERRPDPRERWKSSLSSSNFLILRPRTLYICWWTNNNSSLCLSLQYQSILYLTTYRQGARRAHSKYVRASKIKNIKNLIFKTLTCAAFSSSLSDPLLAS